MVHLAECSTVCSHQAVSPVIRNPGQFMRTGGTCPSSLTGNQLYSSLRDRLFPVFVTHESQSYMSSVFFQSERLQVIKGQ